MRARAGDPPRTMAQKILAARARDPTLVGDLVEVRVDQVALARAPLRAFAEALQAGLHRTPVEVAVAYDGECVTDGASAAAPGAPLAVPEMLARAIVVARPGVGFPSLVHLERFASPARLCVTDDPRLAAVGGIGMLAVVVSPGQLGHALACGSVWLRPPRSVQILLSGRLRPFVCARDVALELLRRGLSEVVRRVEQEHAAPVVLEFGGPSARLVSVGDRAVLAGLAPQVGAAAAVFVGDERTEVFLRDQRRSKAHRALAPDAGAPRDDVVNVDLGGVDPLVLDETGTVRPVRDLVGKPVGQVVLGGDSGITLRDLFAVAALLKSKRVPSHLDFLVAVPSRQMLEVLASAGALTDLISTGARLVEPDTRLVRGLIYPPCPASSGLSLRSYDTGPRVAGARAFAVASAESLAFAVATGEVGDPRSFKRPVRVTVPRALPTDDVLVVRARRSGDIAAKRAEEPAFESRSPWKGPVTLEVVDGETFVASSRGGAATRNGQSGRFVAVVCSTLDEVRELAARAADVCSSVRAVLASFIPSDLVALFSGLGIAAIQLDAPGAKGLRAHKTIALPPPAQWAEREITQVPLGGATIDLTWLARGPERAWVSAGTARPT